MNEPVSEQQLKHLAGRMVIASISGGKDSTALALWLIENQIPFQPVFMDTGWENEITYEYIQGELTRAIGPITVLKPKRDMVELVLHKGMFPSRMRRFCTTELKVKPIIKYLSDLLDQGIDVCNAVGIRAGESEARSKLKEWEWNDGFDAETWRPLIGWSEQDVIDMILKHGVKPNPLYLRGASRVGCWPCIFSRKSELRFIADQDPGRINAIEELERKVAVAARIRAQAKGVTLERDPTFFQSRSGTGACIPIREMVEWSRTTRGGKQFDMFYEQPEGCVRWGLCEAGPDGGDE